MLLYECVKSCHFPSFNILWRLRLLLLLVIYKFYKAENRHYKTKTKRVNCSIRWKNGYKGWKNYRQRCYRHRFFNNSFHESFFPVFFAVKQRVYTIPWKLCMAQLGVRLTLIIILTCPWQIKFSSHCTSFYLMSNDNNNIFLFKRLLRQLQS